MSAPRWRKGGVAVALAAMPAIPRLRWPGPLLPPPPTRGGPWRRSCVPAWPRRMRFDKIGTVVNFGARTSVLYLTGAIGHAHAPT